MGNQISMTNSEPANYRAMPLSEMEETVIRFNQRVDAAQLASPPNKERVRKTLRREGAAQAASATLRL
jgi:hypothetical protein